MTDVAIAGGGIAGLTLAIRLVRDGLTVRVFERARALAPVGAGIWMPPNAMAVLSRLGLAAEIAAAGAELESAGLFDARGRILRALAYWAVPTTHGCGLISMRRSDLHDVLLEALPDGVVQLGAEVRSIDRASEGVAVTFADGNVARARLLVGADGIRSTVREHVRPGVRPRPCGGLCWRGVSDHALPGSLRASAREYWGDGLRFGFSRVPGGVYWFAVVGDRDRADAGPIRPRFLSSDDPIPEPYEEAFVRMPAPVAAILGATAATDRAVSALEELPHFRPWHTDRVVLVGDAAHASSPNLGQGAAMAIEDAWALADSIARHGLRPAALADFDARRRPRVRRVVRESRALGRLAAVRLPVARRVRNVILRRLPPGAGAERLRWLFEPTLDRCPGSAA